MPRHLVGGGLDAVDVVLVALHGEARLAEGVEVAEEGALAEAEAFADLLLVHVAVVGEQHQQLQLAHDSRLVHDGLFFIPQQKYNLPLTRRVSANIFSGDRCGLAAAFLHCRTGCWTLPCPGLRPPLQRRTAVRLFRCQACQWLFFFSPGVTFPDFPYL